MGKTSIEWTDHSVNPIRARDKRTGAVGHYCEKISSGCAHCYASNLQKRFQMPAFGGVKQQLPDHNEIFLVESKLGQVLSRKKPTKYFWEDMSDLFGWWVPDEWIDRCFAVMALTPHHTHQVLTKRPERAAEWFSKTKSGATREQVFLSATRKLHWPGWPLPNVWIGTSIENQETADRRIPDLLKIPAAVRFLSAEPLLGPIDLDKPRCEIHDRDSAFLDESQRCECCGDCRADGLIGEMPFGCWLDPCADQTQPGINWVIVGGESGPGARPMHPDWVRAIRDQCQAAGVAFFFKQWGEWVPFRLAPFPDTPKVDSAWRDWGDGQFSERVGKKAAGRILDGREWSEFPESLVIGG